MDNETPRRNPSAETGEFAEGLKERSRRELEEGPWVEPPEGTRQWTGYQDNPLELKCPECGNQFKPKMEQFKQECPECGNDGPFRGVHKTNPYADPMSRYPRIEDMVHAINQLKVQEMHQLADIDQIPLSARQSLMVFIESWRIGDPNHERYIQFIPEGFPVSEALMMGDLLSFSIVEGEERKSDDKDPHKLIPWKAWQDDLRPFYKKIPPNLSIKDLVGLHVKLLNMLPQFSYNQYTIAQVFSDDPDMLRHLVGEKIRLSPLEFESLSMLTRIVETGAIEQFKLAMQRGSRKSLAELSKTQRQDMGSLILDAFKMAKKAVRYFVQGDFAHAVREMESLNSNYGIGANSFAEGIDEMFVATMAAASVSSTQDRMDMKGDPKPVFMSLDTSFAPAAPYDGWPGGAKEASLRVRRVASSAPLITSGNDNIYKGPDLAQQKPIDRKRYGTTGQRLVIGSKITNTAQITVTDWFTIFAAALCPHDDMNARMKSSITGLIGAGKKPYDWVFPEQRDADRSRPILRFIIHGHLQRGVKDLMPKGLLTVALTPANEAKHTIGKSHAAIPKITADLLYQNFDDIAQIREDEDDIDLPIWHSELTDAGDDTDLQRQFEEMSAGVGARRKGAKRPSKKKVTQGQLIAIEFTPSTQVRLSTATETGLGAHHWYKQKMKDDKELKDLWAKYGKGNKPIKGKGKDRGKYKWRGKVYTSKESVKKAITKEGSYADYKDGMANMRMNYAERKDNGNLVPFRLYVPKILVRQEGTRLVAKSGSKDTKVVKRLLSMIEKEFGILKFKVKPLSAGGYDTQYATKKSGDKKPPKVRVDRGVSKIFKAEGLETGDRYSTNAHPSGLRADGTMIYTAMTRGGIATELEMR